MGKGNKKAAGQALEDLVALVKKMVSASATNIFVTADHGFLYQDTALPESGFLSTQPHGDALVKIRCHYVLGNGLKDDPRLRR